MIAENWRYAQLFETLRLAGAGRVERSTLCRNPNSNGLLVILTPQDMTDPTQTAEHLKTYAKLDGKPILASWMGGPDVEAGDEVSTEPAFPTSRIPTPPPAPFTKCGSTPTASRGIYETPALAQRSAFGELGPVDAKELINNALEL